MKRKNFLQGMGLVGLGSLIPIKFGKAAAISSKLAKAQLNGVSCVLIPQETSGPYPFDLSGNPNMFRQDVTEGNPGIPMTLTLTIVNVNDNCHPLSGLRVDIWHCNKDGYYSEFDNQPGYLGTQNHSGETFFRGIQMTDSNGQVQFTTIYPGWYPGRVTHIHFQVFLNSVLKATSQLAFPESITTAVYNDALYSVHGQNPTTNDSDGVFSDSNNTQYEILTVTGDNSSGYQASLIVGIDVPVTGVINLDLQTGGQFVLKQNYPNPFSSETIIPFTLKQAAHVKFEVFDLMGRKVLDLLDENLVAGEHKLTMNRNLGTRSLSAGNYIYQITTKNDQGIYRQCKMLTVN